MKNHLDLGCGNKIFDIKSVLEESLKHNQFESFGIDIQDFNFKNYIKCNLFLESIPFENNFFDYVTAMDFIEHVPRYIFKEKIINPYIELMNEIYRVLKIGGTFIIKVPPYNTNFFNDPTHVNPVTIDSISAYFCSLIDDNLKQLFPLKKFPENPWAKQYGFNGDFKLVGLEYNNYEENNHDKNYPEILLIALEKI